MSFAGKTVGHKPASCWAVAFTTASFTHTAPDILASWAVDLAPPSGSLCWIWARKADGSEARNKTYNLGSHTNTLVFTGWESGDSGQGWFEARSPSGELLGKSAVLAIPTS
jgi:hypothetical protein